MQDTLAVPAVLLVNDVAALIEAGARKAALDILDDCDVFAVEHLGEQSLDDTKVLWLIASRRVNVGALYAAKRAIGIHSKDDEVLASGQA